MNASANKNTTMKITAQKAKLAAIVVIARSFTKSKKADMMSSFAWSVTCLLYWRN